MVVGGTRILRQYLPQLLQLFGFQPSGNSFGNLHLKLVVLVLLREPFGGFRMTVGGEQIGLDVVDGSAVHEVSATYEKSRIFGIEVGLDELHAGEPDGIGPERRARGENAHTAVAAESRRPHRRRPALLLYLRKTPNQPQMGKLLNAAQRFGIPELRLKHDARPQRRHQPALPRDPELRRELAANTGDNV